MRFSNIFSEIFGWISSTNGLSFYVRIFAVLIISCTNGALAWNQRGYGDDKPELICSNGRKGTDFAGKEICICDESFFGPFCTEQKPCVNGKYKKFKCICEDTFQGDECRTPICENGHLLLGADICVCDKGHMGTHCELCAFEYERVMGTCRLKEEYINRQMNHPAYGPTKFDPNGHGATFTVASLSSPAAIGGIVAGLFGLCVIAFGVCAYRKRKAELSNTCGLEHQESFPGTWSKNRISSFLDSIYVARTSTDHEPSSKNDVKRGSNGTKLGKFSPPSGNCGENQIMLTSSMVEVIQEQGEFDELPLDESSARLTENRLLSESVNLTENRLLTENEDSTPEPETVKFRTQPAATPV